MILGAIVGLLGSFLPKAIELYKDRQDKKHELELLKLQMEQAEKMTQLHIEEAKAMAWLEADKQAYMIGKPEFQPTGKTWLDAIQILSVVYNSTVRPTITYLLIGFYIIVKYAMIISLINSGTTWVEAVKVVYSSEDSEFVSAVVAFWFGSRALFRLKKGDA